MSLPSWFEKVTGLLGPLQVDIVGDELKLAEGLYYLLQNSICDGLKDVDVYLKKWTPLRQKKESTKTGTPQGVKHF